jgi:DNA-binding NarL/FixJ family response regulator
MIKIALAEDNNFLAHSLINKLGLFDEFKVKFHALDGEELLATLEQDANIDVILMDIQMPVLDGVLTTQSVTKLYPHIKVIMLTVLDTEQSIYEAIKAGAIGYLVKESSPQDIYDSIHEILNGGAPMSPSVARKAMKIIQNPNVLEAEKKDFGLSEREFQVLQHLCKGLNYNQIASNLIISPNTVRRHIENVYKKLDVKNKSEAQQLAYKFNLV